MRGIFVSYRRDDSGPSAGRLYDHLRLAFPTLSVFMDVDAVQAGADFVESIETNLAQSAVVIAVIGPQWDSVQNADGTRRLDDPNDYVVRELSRALELKLVIVPVLVGGAQMPSAASLPAALRDLARQNAVVITHAKFADDVMAVCEVVSRTLELPLDRERSYMRARRGEFIPSAALSKARRQFVRVLWTNFALVVLLALLLQLFDKAPPRTAAGASANLECEAIKSEQQRLVCTQLEAVRQTVQGLPCAGAKSEKERAECLQVTLAFEKGAASFMDIVESAFDKLAPMLILVVAAVLLWIYWKLQQGRRWARLVFAMLALSQVGAVYDLIFDTRSTGLIYALQATAGAVLILTYAWLVRASFTEPIKRWFSSD